MRIAVCDDDRQELLQVLRWLTAYRDQRQADLRFQGFDNVLALLDAIDSEKYDLLLLDILMPGLNGIQAAHEIRKKNEDVQIVFLTSSPEFAVESYSVHAANYLLKPATQERLFPVLDQVFRSLQRPEEALIVETRGSVFRIPFEKLEFVEIMAKTLYFHIADGTMRETYGSLSEYEPALLGRFGFHKVHRSYLVNFRWVSEVGQGEILMSSGHRVPIARAAVQQTRTAYMEYLFDVGLEEDGGRNI